MDIDKAGRVRSYVHAQLPFVPLYGTDLLGPVQSLPEAFDLQTPVLTARNPPVTILPELYPQSASVCFEVQGSGGVLAQPGPTLNKNPTEIQKTRLAKRPLEAGERKRPLRLKTHTWSAPDPDSSSKLAKEHTSAKRSRRGYRGKPRLPISLSFLYGFTPKNVGPSRLTIPAGGKGLLGKGKSSSTVASTPLSDLTAQPLLHGEPESIATSLQLPSAPLGRGLDRDETTYPGKQQHTLKFAGKITEDIKSHPDHTKEILDDRSTTWDIELEDNIPPSNSSSFAWGTTVVIDAERIWNHQPLQTTMDSCGKLRSLAARSPDKHSRSSPRVASRFFSKSMSSLHEDSPAPRKPTPDWENRPDKEPGVPTWDDFVHGHCTDVELDLSSDQETNPFLGDYCRTHLSSLADNAHQETIPDWNDMQSLDTSLIESTGFEGNYFPVGDLSLEVGYEMLPDRDTLEGARCFFEGRGLLLGARMSF